MELFIATLTVLMIGVIAQDDHYRRLDLHDESINDLRRRIDKMAEERRMHDEQFKNTFNGCHCKEGPQGPKGERGYAGLPGPAGFSGLPGPKGDAFEWEGDNEFCLVVIGDSCPNGFSPNHTYDHQLGQLSTALTLRSCCK